MAPSTVLVRTSWPSMLSILHFQELNFFLTFSIRKFQYDVHVFLQCNGRLRCLIEKFVCFHPNRLANQAPSLLSPISAIDVFSQLILNLLSTQSSIAEILASSHTSDQIRERDQREKKKGRERFSSCLQHPRSNLPQFSAKEFTQESSPSRS